MRDAELHILLADDDRDDVEMFQSAADECAVNIKVSTAENGKILMDLLEKVAVPDFILLDLNMPRMNGYECLEAIRKNEKYNTVNIMILSTSALKKDINYCLDNGADYYVVKPSNFNDLKNLVGDMGNGREINKIINWEHK